MKCLLYLISKTLLNFRSFSLLCLELKTRLKSHSTGSLDGIVTLYLRNNCLIFGYLSKLSRLFIFWSALQFYSLNHLLLILINIEFIKICFLLFLLCCMLITLTIFFNTMSRSPNLLGSEYTYSSVLMNDNTECACASFRCTWRVSIKFNLCYIEVNLPGHWFKSNESVVSNPVPL